MGLEKPDVLYGCVSILKGSSLSQSHTLVPTTDLLRATSVPRGRKLPEQQISLQSRSPSEAQVQLSSRWPRLSFSFKPHYGSYQDAAAEGEPLHSAWHKIPWLRTQAPL